MKKVHAPDRVPATEGISRRAFLRRSAGLAAITAFGATIWEACTAAVTPSPSSTQASAQLTPKPVKGGHVTQGLTSEIAGLDPLRYANRTYETVVNLLYLGLLALRADGTLVPVLAQSLPKVSSDGLTYTFDLRKDVKWTDGQPVTADDVVFTYKLLYHPSYKAYVSTYRPDVEAILADAQAPDPYTVVLKTKTLSAPFLSTHTRYLVLPQRVLGGVDAAALNTHDFNTAPTVSAGPFKFQEWKKGDHVTLTRNDGYFLGAPNLDSFVLKFGDESSIANQIKTGEIDLFASANAARYDDFAASPNIALDLLDSSVNLHIWYNLDPAAAASKIFSSKPVRQALRYAADLQGILNAAMFKYAAMPDSSGVFPRQSWANNPNGKPYPLDKAKAEQLLDADGWTKGANGFRAKAGVPLKFDFSTSGDNQQWQQVATILQQNWREIGADVTLRTPRYAELTTAGLNRSFDLLMYNANYPQNVDPDPSSAFHSRNAVKGALNMSSYKNPQLDQLLDQAAGTLDQAKRKEFYFGVQDILNEELPCWNNPVPKSGWVRNKRVVNMGPERVGPYSQGSRWLMNDVWVTDGK